MRSVVSLLLFGVTALTIVACGDPRVSSRIVAETPVACDPPNNFAPTGISELAATKITEPEIQREWNEECWLFLTAQAGPKPPRDRVYTPPAETPVPYRTGIIPGGNTRGPFRPTNQWNGYYNGEPITIRAGVNLSDRAGVVQVERPGEGNDDWLRTAPGSGGLEIVGVEGTLVTLVEEGGRSLTLNIATGVLSADSTPIAGGSTTPVTTEISVETPVP